MLETCRNNDYLLPRALGNLTGFLQVGSYLVHANHNQEIFFLLFMPVTL